METISDSREYKRRICSIPNSSSTKYDCRHMYASFVHLEGPDTNAAFNGNKEKRKAERET